MEIEWEYPELAAYQRQWIDTSIAFRFVAIEGATGTGKTHVYEPWMFQCAHEPKAKGNEFWWVSPSVGQARAVYDSVKRQLESAGVVDYYRCNDTDREVETPQGGIMCFKTGENPDLLFGIRNVQMVIVDEFTRCRIALWAALLSVANKTGAHVTFIGNYQGDDSAWHLWAKTMEADPEFRYFKTTALAAVDAGIMPRERFETARRTLPHVIFLALYMCEGSVDPSLLVTLGAVHDLWTNDTVPEGDAKERYITADIALQGSDRFVMGVWYGMRLKEITVRDKMTAKQVEDILKGKATEHGVPRSHIAYDADGLGAYLDSYLNGAASYRGGTVSMPHQGQKLSYHRLRDQCHFLTADAITARSMAIDTPLYREELTKELLAVLRKKGQNAAGQWQVYSKDEPEVGAKARLGHSPDYADMFVMRQFLELTPTPLFAAGLEATAQRRRVSFKPQPKHEGHTKFEGR